ncbi:YfhO family protein [Terribacillus sp. DMT04]|uniref:YfhO family protein n=1 Tax=Terribacillus sp. DMT04 TaxID=2850441 RepID=UPI001C2B9778|nr:YfhO family protein [Terribacillus sp. DMT04]QXE02111.1 YfhO family protein [Terribacillus sp. DMT04]
MKRRGKVVLLILAALIFSIAVHMHFISEYFDGRFMLGPNDGMAQMLPFKQHLYEQYTQGNFFYSFSFGLGGGIYSQLAYYFSTSIVYLLTLLSIKGLELAGVIGSPDVITWARAILPVSIIRLAAALLLAVGVFRYLRIPYVPAFIGACFYAGSAIYFRHVVYWEFFANAFLWLPLLVLGAEKIIRERKPYWMIAAVALSVFDNFYFSYISFLFIGIYVIARWLIKLSDHEVPIRTQLLYFVPAVILGFGIGAISFVPAVYAFLNNYRPAFEDVIPFYENEDNILFTSRTLFVPVLFVLLVCTVGFYKNKLFRLFALLSILFIFFQGSPRIASIFNGFSAPQYRFEYLSMFVIAGTIAVGITLLTKVKKWHLLFAIGLVILLYSLYLRHDLTLEWGDDWAKQVWTGVVLVLLAFLLYACKRKPVILGLCMVVVFATYVPLINAHQEEQLTNAGNVETSTLTYLKSDKYANKEQQELIREVLDSDDRFTRLEWKTDNRNNTNLVQGFPGVSIYSSILNKELLFFYYYDMNIDMKRESVSRISGFGSRANLYSLLNGKYIMYDKREPIEAPYGFTLYIESDRYVVYRNENLLPFAKVADDVLTEETLVNYTPLERERAMLDGIILADGESTSQAASLPDLMNKVSIQAVGGSYQNGQLQVEQEEGGLNLQLDGELPQTGDYYLSFYLKNNDPAAPLFDLTVNEFQTDRKSRQSIYRTKVNELTIRVKAADTIRIRLPKGSYNLEDLHLQHEDYQKLENSVTEAEDIPFSIGHNQVTVDYTNEQEGSYMKIPVPYEKGWQVSVNGEEQELQKADYAFLGVKLQTGDNHIVFTYRPPYWNLVLALCIGSLLFSVGWAVFLRKRHMAGEKDEKEA